MKINKDGTRVTFISKDPWYSKERLGFKQNTVRRFCTVEQRESLEAEMLISSLYTLQEIEIREAATNQSFIRLLSDVSYYDGTFIFSWIHQGDVGSVP